MRRGEAFRGFGAGAAGGLAAILVLFAYRYATGMPTLPEALAERMIRLLPYQVFALFLEKLQHLAKPLGFVMAIVTSVIGFGLGGVLFAGIGRTTRRPRPLQALITAAVTWGFLTFVFLPFIPGLRSIPARAAGWGWSADGAAGGRDGLAEKCRRFTRRKTNLFCAGFTHRPG